MVRLESDRWVVERIGSDGKRRTLPDLVPPPDTTDLDSGGARRLPQPAVLESAIKRL